MPKTLGIIFRSPEIYQVVQSESLKSAEIPPIYNPSSLEDLENQIRSAGDFDCVTIIAPGERGHDFPRVKINYTKGPFLPITKIIDVVNRAREGVKTIHFNSDFAGHNFESLDYNSIYRRALIKSLLPGQTLFLSNGKHLANSHNFELSEAFIRDPNMSLGEAILASPESLIAVRNNNNGELSLFEHQIFGHSDEDFLVSNLKSFLENEIDRAKEFENSDKAKEKLNSLSDEDLKFYLQESIYHIIVKTLHKAGQEHFEYEPLYQKIKRAVGARDFDQNFQDHAGRTILMQAAFFGGDTAKKWTEVFLEDFKADVNILDNYGYGAAMIAVMRAKYNIGEILIDHGAKNIDDPRGGLNAYGIAIERENLEIMKAFERNGIHATPRIIEYAVMRGNFDAIKLMVESGVDVDFTSFDVCRPLVTAIEHGKKDLAKFLINRCYNLESVNEGHTPLQMAIYKQDDELIGLINERMEIITAEKLKEVGVENTKESGLETEGVLASNITLTDREFSGSYLRGSSRSNTRAPEINGSNEDVPTIFPTARDSGLVAFALISAATLVKFCCGRGDSGGKKGK